MLDPSRFAILDGCWGPHTIERFTSVKTKQLDRFCSRFLNSGCEAVDAFTVSWVGDYNWLFPPPYLVPCVLHHMHDGREDRILLVPEWPSASWWPLLLAKHGSWHGFLTASLRIQPYEGLSIQGGNSKLCFYCRRAVFFTSFEVVLLWCTCSFVASLECYSLSSYDEWLFLGTSPASSSGCSVYPLYSCYHPVMGISCWQVSCFVTVTSLALCYGNYCIFWSTVMVSQPVMGLLELLWHFSLSWPELQL